MPLFFVFHSVQFTLVSYIKMNNQTSPSLSVFVFPHVKPCADEQLVSFVFRLAPSTRDAAAV